MFSYSVFSHLNSPPSSAQSILALYHNILSFYVRKKYQNLQVTFFFFNVI